MLRHFHGLPLHKVVDFLQQALQPQVLSLLALLVQHTSASVSIRQHFRGLPLHKVVDFLEQALQ